jgi:hypothetical protein
VSTDGRASFVSFAYESEGLIDIEDFSGPKIVGFDAGDGRRSATLVGPGIPSTLETLNLFRIDGM